MRVRENIPLLDDSAVIRDSMRLGPYFETDCGNLKNKAFFNMKKKLSKLSVSFASVYIGK